MKECYLCHQKKKDVKRYVMDQDHQNLCLKLREYCDACAKKLGLTEHDLFPEKRVAIT